MADSIGSDASELGRLAADLGKVADNAVPNIRKALDVTSGKIRKTWREKLGRSPTLPGLPGALSWDVTGEASLTGSVLQSEIGFDKQRYQGPLGNISEFGTPTVTGRGFGLASLHENEADFQRGLEIAIEQAEREAGL